MSNSADAGNEVPEELQCVWPETIVDTEDAFEPEEFDPETSNLVQHARYELDRAGMGDEDADYGGALKGAVMELIETFARQGHSGYSAMATISLFEKLAKFEPLGNITSDPSEWTHVHGFDDEVMWQNKRRGTSFSRDGGKTWYDIEDASLNNGDTWYSEEETTRWLAELGLDNDSQIVLDSTTKYNIQERLMEMQQEYARAHNEPVEDGLIVDEEHNRKVREWHRNQGK